MNFCAVEQHVCVAAMLSDLLFDKERDGCFL